MSHNHLRWLNDRLEIAEADVEMAELNRHDALKLAAQAVRDLKDAEAAAWLAASEVRQRQVEIAAETKRVHEANHVISFPAARRCAEVANG